MKAELLDEIAEVIKTQESVADRCRAVASLVLSNSSARWVGIYSVDETTVSNEAWSGPGPPEYPSFPRTAGLTAQAIATNAPALSNDVAHDPRYLANQEDSGSELILPVLVGGRVAGTLDIESDVVGAFDGQAITEFERVAEVLSDLWR